MTISLSTVASTDVNVYSSFLSQLNRQRADNEIFAIRQMFCVRVYSRKHNFLCRLVPARRPHSVVGFGFLYAVTDRRTTANRVRHSVYTVASAASGLAGGGAVVRPATTTRKVANSAGVLLPRDDAGTDCIISQRGRRDDRREGPSPRPAK